MCAEHRVNTATLGLVSKSLTVSHEQLLQPTWDLDTISVPYALLQQR